MGLINPDLMTLDSGIQLSNCYLSFTPGPIAFPFEPLPLTYSWTIDSSSNKQFFASGTLFIYASKASKRAGLAPIQQKQVSISADSTAAGVFGLFYSNLMSQFPNAVSDDGADSTHTRAPAPTS